MTARFYYDVQYLSSFFVNPQGWIPPNRTCWINSAGGSCLHRPTAANYSTICKRDVYTMKQCALKVLCFQTIHITHIGIEIKILRCNREIVLWLLMWWLLLQRWWLLHYLLLLLRLRHDVVKILHFRRGRIGRIRGADLNSKINTYQSRLKHPHFQLIIYQFENTEYAAFPRTNL